jgi:hypothetical protein
MKRCAPTHAEAAMLRRVLRGAKAAGLRVPQGITLRVVDHLPGKHGYAYGNVITVERASLTPELLCHEVAHVLVDQIVAHNKAADHNRFWALVYAVLYQQVVQA